MHTVNRIDTILWLALLLACAAGGWHFGSSFHAPSPESAVGPTRTPVQPPPGKSPPSAFPGASRRASWIERVKAAKPGDFPALVAEWKVQFPEDDRYEDGRPPNALAALQWLHGMWLVKDPDGFFRALSDGSDEETIHPGSAAIAMVELMPEKAVAMIGQKDQTIYDRFFLNEILSGLARNRPELYLQLNPDGRFSLYMEYEDSSAWVEAITNLAKTDAPAAGNACLHWKGSPSYLLEGFRAVAVTWGTGAPDFATWANTIQDPYIRSIAHDARLTVMAVQDPMAALAELSKTETDPPGCIGMAKAEILRRLAEKDPMAALKLIGEVEDYFFSETTKEIEFGDPFGPSISDPGTNKLLSAFHGIASGGIRSDNYLRSVVLASIPAALPDDPAELFAGMRRLTADLGRDASWQKEIEGSIIRSKHGKWSIEQCRAAAIQWVNDYPETGVDETLQALASQAVQNHPEKVLSELDEFPEVMRLSLKHELILALPASEHEQRANLLHQLPVDSWDWSLGAALGKNADDYAELVTALPAAESANFVSNFVSAWAENDPEMAARWLPTLSDPVASAQAARDLVLTWFGQDGDAAAAWVNTLPQNEVRDAAVASIVRHQADEDPTDAWRWVNTISDARARAEAYDQLAYRWKRDAPPPPEFHEAHRQARQNIGLPAYQKPAEVEDPFR